MKDVKGSDDIQHSFYRAKVGEVSEEKLPRPREGGAPPLRAKLGSEFIRIDEVRDDFDWAACAEAPQGLAGKLIAHGPDRDTAISRMREALRQFRIGPHQTTISMQRA